MTITFSILPIAWHGGSQPGCSRIHSQAYLLEEGGIELAFGTEGGGLEGECLLSLRIEGRVLDERVDEYPAESNESSVS
jgi:hypothetical protein